MSFFNASTIADLEPAAMVLAEVHRRATECGSDIMVVGAVARDILIHHATGSAPHRATADIDIAVAVSSWQDVDRLTGTLEETGGGVHKFLVRGVEVDIIPFGGIESQERTITWPNHHMMDVSGFKEALDAAVHVALPGGLTIAVASLPAQSVLKLFAWRDRRYQNRRDAIDLRTILEAYHEGPYLDELYANYESLLVRHDFDPVCAGAERLGHEASAIIGPANRRVVTELLFSDERFSALAADMGPLIGENRALLSAYRGGFTQA